MTTALLLLASSCFLAGTPAQADVLRWNGARQGLQAPGAFVLRYAADGTLIGPERDVASIDPFSGGEEVEEIALAATATTGQGARLAAVLPALRLTTARYEGRTVLAALGLSPRDWALLFQALVNAESGFNPAAVSPAGARGLAQLMPDTARALGVEIDDPRDNLDGGARYLLAQIETFGSLELALAAYNAGPDAVRQYGGIPPFAETRAYVARVLAEFERLIAVSAALSEEGTPL